MTPVICMITDRQRHGETVEQVVRRVAAAARAGVQLVQVRERDLDARSLTGLVAACVAAVRHSPTRILVNDRLDVAQAARAHGVHLRADSVSAARVRPVVPRGFLIGRSIHSLAEAQEAEVEALDYLLYGTVFPSVSKPGVRPAGTDELAAAAAATTIPVLAVGGITAENAGAVGRTGVAGVAAIGLFPGGMDEDSVQRAVIAVKAAFDTSPAGS